MFKYLIFLFALFFSLCFYFAFYFVPDNNSSIIVEDFTAHEKYRNMSREPIEKTELKVEFTEPEVLFERNGVKKESIIIAGEMTLDYYFRCPPQAFFQMWLSLRPKERQSGVVNEKVAARSLKVKLFFDTDKRGLSYSEEREVWFQSMNSRWTMVVVPLEQFADHITSCYIDLKGQQIFHDNDILIGSPGIYRHSESIVTDERVVHSPPSKSMDGPWSDSNLIVMLVDTVRADKPGFNGNSRVKTPALDLLAKMGIVFPNTFSSSSWTKPAIGTIFTGYTPLVHQAKDRGDVLSESVPTLAELFQKKGYRTLGVVSNGNISSQFFFDRGFDEYILGERPDKKITEVVKSKLPESKSDRFFFYVHYGDPHFPYQSPVQVRRMYDLDYDGDFDGHLHSLQRLKRLGKNRPERDLDYVKALYDVEITLADRQIGKLLYAVLQANLLAETSFIFLSDHGDEFFEHDNFTHGKSLYSEVTDVPLIFTPGGWTKRGSILMEKASLIDIKPTICHLFSLDESGYLGSGLPLLSQTVPEASAEKMNDSRFLFYHLQLDSKSGIALSDGEFKVISFRGQRNEFYRVSEDQNEQRDCSERFPVAYEYYSFLLNKYATAERNLNLSIHGQKEVKTVKDDELHDDVRKNLEALGYLQ